MSKHLTVVTDHLSLPRETGARRCPHGPDTFEATAVHDLVDAAFLSAGRTASLHPIAGFRTPGTRRADLRPAAEERPSGSVRCTEPLPTLAAASQSRSDDPRTRFVYIFQRQPGPVRCRKAEIPRQALVFLLAFLALSFSLYISASSIFS